MNFIKKVSLASALLCVSLSSQATIITFDDEGSFTEQTFTSKDIGDFTISGGASLTFNLAPTVTQSFDRSSVTAQNVIIDTGPANGGLAVAAGPSDNLEGSYNNNVNNDEILFFDFDFNVSLTEILLNAGAGTGHQDLFASDAPDVFGVFVSNDMTTYTSVTTGNVGISGGEILDLTYPVTGQYFAIAHVGPVNAIGGYIESIAYSAVPAPATLALFGLGLAGLGFTSRKKKA